MVEEKEKGKDIDSTEIGKMFKELIAKPGDGENPLYLSVMLRIGQLYKHPNFHKKTMTIAKQICHETNCGCSNQEDDKASLKGQGY